MKTFGSIADLRAVIGEEIGTSEWIEIDQAARDLYVEATGDDQYLTLSLLPAFQAAIYQLNVGTARLNYGSNGARFPAPLHSGDRVRGRLRFSALDETAAGHALAHDWVVEIEGAPEPACTVETITLIVQ